VEARRRGVGRAAVGAPRDALPGRRVAHARGRRVTTRTSRAAGRERARMPGAPSGQWRGVRPAGTPGSPWPTCGVVPEPRRRVRGGQTRGSRPTAASSRASPPTESGPRCSTQLTHRVAGVALLTLARSPCGSHGGRGRSVDAVSAPLWVAFGVYLIPSSDPIVAVRAPAFGESSATPSYCSTSCSRSCRSRSA